MGLACEKIIKQLEEQYPPSCAEEWDNVGLLVGRMDQTVEKVYVALDLTQNVLEEALGWGADLILTHHPMIFGAVKKVNDQDFVGRKILQLAESHTAYYAMHTNFDVLAMAEINEKLLKLSDTCVLYETGTDSQGRPIGIGRVGSLPCDMELEECARFVKKSFGLAGVRVFGDRKQVVRRAAVSGGSGKSMVSSAISKGAQVLITGDMDHHTGLDGVDQGLCIIDAGHYGTEYFFISYMENWMRQTFPQLQFRSAGFCQPAVDL